MDELASIHAHKSARREPAELLGPAMVGFFKQTVARRHTKLSAIAQRWGALVPELLNDHCALESFSRGTLTVVLDSSPHLYELKQLLLAGLQAQLLMACRSAGLRKITLKVGRWSGDDGEERRRQGEFE